MFSHLIQHEPPGCGVLFNCCDCGGNGCGCRYCFACNACKHCAEDDGQPCEYLED